jgi:hypothetical protein
MEAMLGISLYIYLYPKLAKTLCLSYYLLCFLFNKMGEREGRTGSAQKWGVGKGEVAQTMYTHVSKCKNDKKKKKAAHPCMNVSTGQILLGGGQGLGSI